jgi:YidC/Oxa1 family membrane protein insertase
VNKNTVGFILSVALLFAGYYAANTYFSTQRTAQDSAQVEGAHPQSEAGSSPTEPSSIPAAETSSSGNTPGDGKEPNQTPAQTAESAPPPSIIEAPFTTDNSPPLLRAESASVAVEFAAKGGCIQETHLKNYSIKSGGADQVAGIDKLEPCKALGFKVGALDLRDLPARLSEGSGNPERSVTIEQRTADLHIKRTFTLNDSGYGAQLDVEIVNTSAAPAVHLIEMEIGATSSHKDAAGFLSFDNSGMRDFAYRSDGDVSHTVLPFESSPSSKVLVLEPSIPLDWAATGGNYFHFAIAPLFKEGTGIRVERQPFNMQPNRQSPPERTIYEAWVQNNIQLNPGESRALSYFVYLGPKKIEDLKAAGHNLEESINFGFFRIVAWPMFRVLGFLDQLVGNWGVAIIILTLLIRLLFLPLTAKSYKASKKMQKMQPLMNELREKYKDDKQKQQQELMALMSKEGVNPLGGCLPILPQIPVFFGLNSVLMHTFELRQAPFALWLTDLSKSDPYYVTPVIMALLMYLQQKMIPMPSMDPNQARMMRFLPLIFAVFMISYPSGLVLYIITSTVFSMAQQQFMTRRFKDA